MGPYLLDKQTASYNSPYDLEMSLAMDVVAFQICGGENGTNGCHLAVYSEDVTFACPFMNTRPPPAFSTCRSASGIGYISKKAI